MYIRERSLRSYICLVSKLVSVTTKFFCIPSTVEYQKRKHFPQSPNSTFLFYSWGHRRSLCGNMSPLHIIWKKRHFLASNLFLSGQRTFPQLPWIQSLYSLHFMLPSHLITWNWSFRDQRNPAHCQMHQPFSVLSFLPDIRKVVHIVEHLLLLVGGASCSTYLLTLVNAGLPSLLYQLCCYILLYDKFPER